MNAETQKHIGTFLRRKREEMNPEDVGLARYSRARTPGLRREDVAAMAGISTVWYSKIERGQADGISREALLALSRVLRLNPPEHQYLMNLAQQLTALELSPGIEITDQTRTFLGLLNPLPAIVMNDYFDILATNHAYRAMCGLELDALPLEERNYISLVFSSADWKRFLQVEDTDSRQRKLARLVGTLRGVSASRPNDIGMRAKIRNFQNQSEEFSKLWKMELVAQPEETDFSFTHASLGPIVLRKQIWLNYSGEKIFRLNIFNPLDECTYERLARTASQQSPRDPSEAGSHGRR